MAAPAAPVRDAVERAGHVFFRIRNACFPVVFGAILAAFPPAPWGRFAALEIAAALALIAAGQSIRVVTIGFRYIKRGGRDGRVFAHDLVTGGVFAHCRNPMYLGNLLILLGYFVLAGNPYGLAAGVAFFGFAYGAIIRAEETYLAGRFGADYEAYRAAVPRLLPRLRGLRVTLRGMPFDARKVVSKEHGTLYVTLLLTLGLFAWRAHRAGGLGNLLPALLAVAGAGSVLYVAARIAKKKTALLRPPVPDGG